jgi:electron transfer flavoprotein alpha/beta subunit
MRIVILVRSPRARPEGDEILAPLDRCEEAALSLSRGLAGPDDALTALTIGPAADESALRAAIDAGVRRALRVWDGALAGSGTYRVASLLAAGARHVGFDLLLCGQLSTDWGSGLVGPSVAHLLDIPHLSQVRAARLEDRTIVATQRCGRGHLEVRLPLPALLAVHPLADRPDSPIDHRDVFIELLSPADLKAEVPKPDWDALDLRPVPRERLAAPSPDANHLAQRLRSLGFVG